MEMRKFIVEIHPDGRVTCCEYEDPRDVRKSAWLAGFRQALVHCEEQTDIFEGFKDTCLYSKLMYQGAAKVRDVVASCYREYYSD